MQLRKILSVNAMLMAILKWQHKFRPNRIGAKREEIPTHFHLLDHNRRWSWLSVLSLEKCYSNPLCWNLPHKAKVGEQTRLRLLLLVEGRSSMLRQLDAEYQCGYQVTLCWFIHYWVWWLPAGSTLFGPSVLILGIVQGPLSFWHFILFRLLLS